MNKRQFLPTLMHAGRPARVLRDRDSLMIGGLCHALNSVISQSLTRIELAMITIARERRGSLEHSTGTRLRPPARLRTPLDTVP